MHQTQTFNLLLIHNVTRRPVLNGPSPFTITSPDVPKMQNCGHRDIGTWGRKIVPFTGKANNTLYFAATRTNAPEQIVDIGEGDVDSLGERDVFKFVLLKNIYS